MIKTLTPTSALMSLAARDNPSTNHEAWRQLPPERDISAANFLERAGFDPAARALIDPTLNANALETYAMANVWRSLKIFAEDSAIGAS